MEHKILFQDSNFYDLAARSWMIRNRRQIMSFMLILSDAVSVGVSFISAIYLWAQVRADIQIQAHLDLLIPAMIFFVVIYRIMGLYPAVGIGPVEELKRMSISSSFIMFAFTSLSFFARNVNVYSRAALLIAWILLLVSAPLLRKVTRRVSIKLKLWGIPSAIVGDENSIQHLLKRLHNHPLSGFWPVLCIAGGIDEVFPKNQREPAVLNQINTLIIALDEGKFNAIRHLVTQREYKFNRIIIILDESIGPLWFTPVSMVEHVGFEVAHNLLNPLQRSVKRIIDIVSVIVCAPLLLLAFSLIGLLIKITSPGPVFYKHTRIGRDGKNIGIWKFRTMVKDADKILEEHLKKDPLLRLEWEQNFKLKDDPRITSVGKILRRTSLDELPQIINVLQGEMSLIGPRPIVEEEIPLYGEDFEIYKQVIPGITGLWQISGRSNLAYEDRVILDGYYIQNWSIWLDIHILLHTVLATLQARGAY